MVLLQSLIYPQQLATYSGYQQAFILALFQICRKRLWFLEVPPVQ